MNYLKSKQKTLNKSNVCFSIFNDAFEQEFAHTKQTFTYSKKLWNMFKVNNKETTRRLKTPERRHLRRSSVFILDFEQISHLFLVFL